MSDDQEQYHEMTDENLLKSYSENVKDYKRWIDKEIDLNEGWIEEAEYMSFARSEIHEIVEELDKRKLDVDKSSLKQYDQEWQSWILANTAPNFKLEHSRQGIPKNNWWDWIDQLDTLTDVQRSTF
ncbi:MAG TPA: hypothetical protein VMR45_03130 [Patescibacteria group bacterium]|jgi:hypothetical protein|nr:hypothetical protein [Patescibacteria group bacterium]